MSPSAVERTHIRKARRARRPGWPQKKTLAVVMVGALLAGLMVWRRWSPYGRDPVLQDLAEASDSIVTARSFHRTHFPFPGCVIEGLAFRHGDPTGPPLIAIEILTIRGSYLSLLSQHVPRITAEGMRVTIPPFGTGEPFHTQHSDIVIDEMVARNAVVEFAERNPQKKPLQFRIHEAVLHKVGWSGPIGYELKVRNPEPPGEIAVTGEFGVWHHGDAGETPLSGDYKFEDADLGVYRGVRGKLSSQGHFAGALKHIDVAGKIDIPDFEVRSSGHPVQLLTDFSANVDGRNGDTYLKRVDAHFSRTGVAAEGSIAHIHGTKGKMAHIELTVQNGRIEDVLRLFVREPRAPMSGPVSLKATAEIPAGKEPFLDKLKMEGGFGIEEGSFTKAKTQANVNKLSAGARGANKDDPENVLTDLKGRVVLEHGVAKFSDLSFGIPGAAARMRGTYGIIDHKVNLHGTMQVQSKISNTASGMKAVLLKMMDPIFKKKKNGEIVPVHVGGTYERPQFGLDVKQKGAPSSSGQ